MSINTQGKWLKIDDFLLLAAPGHLVRQTPALKSILFNRILIKNRYIFTHGRPSAQNRCFFIEIIVDFWVNAPERSWSLWQGRPSAPGVNNKKQEKKIAMKITILQIINLIIIITWNHLVSCYQLYLEIAPL